MNSKIKKTNADQLFENLKQIADFIPAPLYWLDTNGIILGFNNVIGNELGGDVEVRNKVLGKRHEDFYPEHVAKALNENNRKVIELGETIEFEEEVVNVLTRQTVYYTSIRSPWRDDSGNIVGIVGVSVNITAQKEAERLRLEAERLQLENERRHHQALLQEKEKLITLACKVAHDINSPVAALRMMIDSYDELAENKRSFLKRATESILDIANNLISNYQTEETATNAEIELRQLLLVSDLLVQLISEKKVQYQDRSVTFETVIANDARFAFIQVQKIELRRALSNLINNAVDALEKNKNGKVTIHLTVDTDAVVVKISDNGKGMSSAMIEKIQNSLSFTEGKENGHGLGLQQVWDTLECNRGIMEVQSMLGKGTSIQLTFPRTAASNWIAQEIHLIRDNIIVILDDDESIHTAWDLRFTPLIASYPAVQLHHFTHGQEALNFLATLSHEKRSQVILLSDFELLHQDRDGLQIIEASAVKNAILVTSYYSNPQIREVSDRLGIKVLPKQMASIIPILVVKLGS